MIPQPSVNAIEVRRESRFGLETWVVYAFGTQVSSFMSEIYALRHAEALRRKLAI